MPRWLARLLMFVVVIFMPPFLVLSNLYVFLNPQYLNYEYTRPDFPKADRFNDADRYHFAAETIEYEAGNRNFEQFQALGVFNDRELNHMVDVRVLIAQVLVFQQMAGLLLLVVLITLAAQRATRVFAARSLLAGSLFTIGLFLLLGLFAATSFDTFFTDFHHVFFSGDTWLFNYSDSLIQFYPVRFWNDIAISLVGLTLVEAVGVGVVGWIWGRRTVGSG